MFKGETVGPIDKPFDTEVTQMVTSRDKDSRRKQTGFDVGFEGVGDGFEGCSCPGAAHYAGSGQVFPEGEPLGGGIALGHLDEFAVGTGW